MARATITIFGSNRPPRGSPEYEAAWEVGNRLAKAGFAVCTGGYGGTMLGASHGAKAGGANVFGITVEPWGPPNEFVTQPIAHPSLIPRLIDLAERGDAYVVLPGGTGTLLEIAYVLEMQHKGSMEPRPMWFLGPQWSAAIRSAFVGQGVVKWVGGVTRMPDYRFFETPAEIAEAAEAHFR
jgi:hypothetical protein